jgi:hypothetical protein
MSAVRCDAGLLGVAGGLVLAGIGAVHGPSVGFELLPPPGHLLRPVVWPQRWLAR